MTLSTHNNSFKNGRRTKRGAAGADRYAAKEREE